VEASATIVMDVTSVDTEATGCTCAGSGVAAGVRSGAGPPWPLMAAA
jgi:hypothetical protein